MAEKILTPEELIRRIQELRKQLMSYPPRKKRPEPTEAELKQWKEQAKRAAPLFAFLFEEKMEEKDKRTSSFPQRRNRWRSVSRSGPGPGPGGERESPSTSSTRRPFKRNGRANRAGG